MKGRDALLLGAVQGLTEFLPISSSAHLALLRRLTGDAHAPRALDVALHLATTAALLPTMRRDLLVPAIALSRDVSRQRLAVARYSPDAHRALVLVLATLPSIAAGAALNRPLERWARRPAFVPAALVAGSAWMAVAEARAGRTAGGQDDHLTAPRALLLGLAQAVALAPGVSRSGATIAAGLSLGLGREEAARESFRLAVPVTLAASVLALPALGRVRRDVGGRAMAAASAAAFISGLAGVASVRGVLVRWGLMPFVLYRCVLALALWRLARCDS